MSITGKQKIVLRANFFEIHISTGNNVIAFMITSSGLFRIAQAWDSAETGFYSYNTSWSRKYCFEEYR